MRRFITKTLFLTLPFVALQTNAATNFYSVSVSDKAFFDQVRKALLSGDVDWFAEAVSYPLVLRLSKGDLKLENKKDLKKHAALIFNAHLKSTVRNQSRDSLFKNWQGVMIGSGEIWFSELGERTKTGERWVYRIIAINMQVRDEEK